MFTTYPFQKDGLSNKKYITVLQNMAAEEFIKTAKYINSNPLLLWTLAA